MSLFNFSHSNTTPYTSFFGHLLFTKNTVKEVIKDFHEIPNKIAFKELI